MNSIFIKNKNNILIKKNNDLNNIVIDNSEVLFIQCIFTNNTNIIINNSKINFKNCSFIKNYNNIISTNKSKLYFSNCILSNNYNNNESLLKFKDSYILFYNNTKIFHNSSKNNDFLQPLYGSIIYNENGNLKISHNTSINNNINYGNWNIGLIYNYKSKLLLTNFTNINNNNGIKSIIYNKESNIIIENNVLINKNQSKFYGTLLFKNCYVSLCDNIRFKNNINNCCGVITIQGFNNNIIIKDNVLFDSNIIYPKLNNIKKLNLCGSCIYYNTYSELNQLLIKDNVKFINNENKKGFGGAIYLGSHFKTNYTDNIFKIKDNVLFQNNSAFICNDIFTNYNLFIGINVNFKECYINYINNIILNSFIKFENNIKIYNENNENNNTNEFVKNINLNLMH